MRDWRCNTRPLHPDFAARTPCCPCGVGSAKWRTQRSRRRLVAPTRRPQLVKSPRCEVRSPWLMACSTDRRQVRLEGPFPECRNVDSRFWVPVLQSRRFWVLSLQSTLTTPGGAVTTKATDPTPSGQAEIYIYMLVCAGCATSCHGYSVLNQPQFSVTPKLNVCERSPKRS